MESTWLFKLKPGIATSGFWRISNPSPEGLAQTVAIFPALESCPAKPQSFAHSDTESLWAFGCLHGSILQRPCKPDCCKQAWLLKKSIFLKTAEICGIENV
jgi:hypothetical protein